MKSNDDLQGVDFFLRSVKNNFSAKLTYIGDQYVLRKGSTVSSSVSVRFKSYKAVIRRRKEAGIKKEDLILKNDIIFKSSSVAGEFVCGSSCNGPSLWKTKNGVTLKEWKQKDYENR